MVTPALFAAKLTVPVRGEVLEVVALQEPGPAVRGREALEAQIELVFEFFGILVGGDAEFVESEFFVTG